MNRVQVPSTRGRGRTDQVDEPLRRYSRRSNIPDEEFETGININPEANAFMSNYPDPRAVAGPSHRLLESKDP